MPYAIVGTMKMKTSSFFVDFAMFQFTRVAMESTRYLRTTGFVTRAKSSPNREVFVFPASCAQRKEEL